MGTHELRADQSEVWWPGTCDWHRKWRQSWETDPLSWGICSSLQAVKGIAFWDTHLV